MKVKKPVLGLITCENRACAQPVELRQADTGWAYYTCNHCKRQVFARDATSDRPLRELLHVAASVPQPVPETPPSPSPEPYDAHQEQTQRGDAQNAPEPSTQPESDTAARPQSEPVARPAARSVGRVGFFDFQRR